MSLFKCFLWLTLCTAIVYSFESQLNLEPISDLIEGVHGTCTHLWGVTDEQIKNYQFSDKSQQMMCYMKCILVEAKWSNPKEEIQIDYIRENIHPSIKEVVLPTVEKCKSDAQVSSNECETSYNFHSCCYNTDPKNYFLP